MIGNHKGKLDPRVIRTRQLIQNALIELLQEMDISKITVNKLSQRATINRVTFYLHYHDIPDLYEKMAEEMVEDIKKIMGKHQVSEDEIQWNVLEEVLIYIADNAKFYKVVLGERTTPIFTNRILSTMKGIIKNRLLHRVHDDSSEVQKEILLWYISAAFIGSISYWLREDMPYSPKYLAKQLSLLFSQNKDLVDYH